MKLLKGQRNNLIFCTACLILTVLIDQLTKYFVLSRMQAFESIAVFKKVFHITLVQNTGIAFGLFKNQVVFFLILPSLAIIWLIYTIFFSKEAKEFSRLYYFALCLILGGAIGNLIDRLRFGHVVDFLDFRIWPVFNLADSAITVGVAIIILKCILSSVK